MKIIEINCETGVETIREATKAEKDAAKLRKEQFQAEQAQAAVKESARQALLTKLGITAEEAQLLLGGN